MPLAYTEDDWNAIEKFLNYSRVRIESRVGASLQTCTAERFIQATIGIAATGCGGDRVKRLLTKDALSDESNKARMTGYLDRLKGVTPTWPGILADQSDKSKRTVERTFPNLYAAAATSCSGIDDRPLCCAEGGGPFYHKTTDGVGGSRRTKSDASKVSLFYEKHGTDYYLVAWGAHAGKDKTGADAVYRVLGVVPGCALRERAILRPPGK